MCIAGEKGVGKTTTTQLLGDGIPFSIYSDDTIRISDDSIGYAPHDLIKYTDETIESLNIKNTNGVKNIANKTYGKIKQSNELVKVIAIMQLTRSREKHAKIIKVMDKIVKRNMLINNVTGISYFPAALVKKILRLKLSTSIEYYRLYTPNNLQDLIDEKANMKMLLEKLKSDYLET